MKLVDATAPKDKALYYGAPCQPNVKGKLWECVSKAEYHAMREAYEGDEGNCNTCVHLKRMPMSKEVAAASGGFMDGMCIRTFAQLRFCPEDPLHLACHEQRKKT